MDFAELLEAQHGAFTRKQAQEAGFSNYRIAQRVKSGEWQAATTTVLVLGGSPTTRRQADRVALLAAGPGSALAGMSAARVHAGGADVRPRELGARVMKRRSLT